MSEQEQKQYWEVDKEYEQKGLCTFNDPGKHYRFYAKWDDMIHFWFYEDEWQLDGDHGDHNEYDYYWMIGSPEQLDDFIARLQSLKEVATAWYAARGERWPVDWEGYVKGGLTLEQARSLKPRQ